MFGTYLLVATLVGSAVLTVWQGWPTRSRIQTQLLPKYDYIIGMKYIVFTIPRIKIDSTYLNYLEQVFETYCIHLFQKLAPK